jgi:hypothetical protein
LRAFSRKALRAGQGLARLETTAVLGHQNIIRRHDHPPLKLVGA